MYQKEELSRALVQASANKSRAEALRVQLRDLDAQLETLTAREAELARQRSKEQADVDALEGNGLAALFYAALGRREEKLDKEKAEAYQAAAHHDAAKMQLANAQREREVRQAELDRLGDSEAAYQAAYRAKRDWLRQNDPVNGAGIARLEAEKLVCDDRRREIAEAIARSGAKAVAILDRCESYNGCSGPLGSEIPAGLYRSKVMVETVNYIYGLAGRDFTMEHVREIFAELEEVAQGRKPAPNHKYIGLRI